MFGGEHIVARAMETGARANVLRIGQVVGDTKWGLWNEAEFLPMVIRSSLVLGVLPLLEEVGHGFFSVPLARLQSDPWPVL